MKQRTILLVVVVGITCIALQVGAKENARVTDEEIQAQFSKAHSVMQDLRESIRRILDGFLVGDAEEINRGSEQISNRMGEVARRYPPPVGVESDEWKALAEIMEQAQLLRDKVQANRYREAYLHYTMLVNRCVACHQARREWGQLSEQKAETPSEDAGAGP